MVSSTKQSYEVNNVLHEIIDTFLKYKLQLYD